MHALNSESKVVVFSHLFIGKFKIPSLNFGDEGGNKALLYF